MRALAVRGAADGPDSARAPVLRRAPRGVRRHVRLAVVKARLRGARRMMQYAWARGCKTGAPWWPTISDRGRCQGVRAPAATSFAKETQSDARVTARIDRAVAARARQEFLAESGSRRPRQGARPLAHATLLMRNGPASRLQELSGAALSAGLPAGLAMAQPHACRDAQAVPQGARDKLQAQPGT